MSVSEEKIDEALRELKKKNPSLPLPLRSWRVETGLDWTDDPAIWVWVILRPGDAGAREKIGERAALQEIVIDRVWERIKGTDDEPWIYVRFDEDEAEPPTAR